MTHGSGPQCPNGHSSMGDGQCNIRGCSHCDPIVTKPTRTGNGKAPDGKASIGGGLGGGRRKR
jgi:hypothetical protein